MIKNNYISVIGLEIHIQLSTKSKAYSADENIYGANPNTKISPISLAYPGTLPSVNTKLIEYALKLGISLECDINKKNIEIAKELYRNSFPRIITVSRLDKRKNHQNTNRRQNKTMVTQKIKKTTKKSHEMTL